MIHSLPFTRVARQRLVRVLACGLAWVAACTAAQAGDVNKGSELYRQHCANCHGQDGRPVFPMAPDFSNPTSLMKPDPSLLQLIRAGKGAMPAYQGLLRDREILDIVAYLRTLR